MNLLTILLKVESASGSALPRHNYYTGTILAISHQIMGVIPNLIKVMIPYEAMLHYQEGNLLGLIAGELMGVIFWKGLPMIISCTIKATTLVAQIIKWGEAACRVGIVDAHPALLQTGHPEETEGKRHPKLG